MKNIFINNEASTNRIRLLAEWTAGQISQSVNENFDVIRFVELELPKIIPGIYLHIESDDVMGARRAFVGEKPLSLVVSESVYEGASQGCLFSSEVVLHEVGHLLLHHRHATLGLNDAHGRYQPQIRDTRVSEGAEWQATSFALCFLYPLASFKETNSPEQILTRYKTATRKQASRILRHVDRMKSARRGANYHEDRSWVKSIVKAFPKPIQPNKLKYTAQLDLFFGTDRLITKSESKNFLAPRDEIIPLS